MCWYSRISSFSLSFYFFDTECVSVFLDFYIFLLVWSWWCWFDLFVFWVLLKSYLVLYCDGWNFYYVRIRFSIRVDSLVLISFLGLIFGYKSWIDFLSLVWVDLLLWCYNYFLCCIIVCLVCLCCFVKFCIISIRIVIADVSFCSFLVWFLFFYLFWCVCWDKCFWMILI